MCVHNIYFAYSNNCEGDELNFIHPTTRTFCSHSFLVRQGHVGYAARRGYTGVNVYGFLYTRAQARVYTRTCFKFLNY